MPLDPIALVGQTIGAKYRIERLIGSGGMGAVYEATNALTERRVALKLMLSSESDVHAERFLREARAASKIEHPNIVQVFDVGQRDDGSLFIVQELLSGIDLAALIDDRRALSPRETRALLAPVMSALAMAHEHGVVHRDVKPNNIFLATDRTGALHPKLIDFGIAKLSGATDSTPSVTRTGTVLGTPLYMSPEQARGEKGVGPQADVWSVGAVMFECLSGRGPFLGASSMDVIVQILTRVAPRLDAVAPETPPAVADLVARALTHERSERFPTMASFLAEVNACPDFDSDQVSCVASMVPSLRSLPAALPEQFASTVGSGDDLGPLPPAAPLSSTPHVTPPSAPHVTPPSTPPAAPPAVAPRPRVRPALIVSAAAVIALAVGARGLRPPTTARAPSLPVAAPPVTPLTQVVAPPPPPAPRPQADVYGVRLHVEPPTATVTLDGARRTVGDFDGSFPRDGARHTLTVTAPGHTTQVVAFEDGPPATASVTLERPLRAARELPRTAAHHDAPVEPPPAPHGPMQRVYE